MKKIVIGCSVIRKEIEKYYDKSADFEFDWLEDHLHNIPEALHKKLQSAIDKHRDADMIYLLYGHCGQAICGIQARQCPIIIPKVEDCIEVLLYHNPEVNEMRRTSYFISQGWLWGNENLGYEYDRIKEKYGEKRALRVVKTMYKNYRYLMYVNTGIEEDRVRHDCSTVAERLGLQLQETHGDIHLLLNMLNGVMDDRYLIVPPEGYVTEEMFRK
ncbi:DUF1638 domain-containing protein [Acetobacterium wieringae]|uniref:DUF1638 domain-containing protein n=1 Tax=Acetobacterium wieringae TaxID=52694 RepID=UPI0026ED51D3|nr:DUF1638 domain-containing protein [Acetobacterium wieringae]